MEDQSDEVSYPAPREGALERACMALCALALVVMLIVIGHEVVLRGVWSRSAGISEEIAGYMLVSIAFLSLPVCLAHDSFQRTEYVTALLSPRGRIVSRLAFDILTFVLALILLWQFAQYNWVSWRTGFFSSIGFRTPNWISALPMVIGTFAFCLALMKVILRNVSALGRMGR